VKDISILDCTLRDGGYCNKWNFGKEGIEQIIESLNDAGIEIVECGFISDKVQYDPDKSKYPTMEAACHTLPENRKQTTYVAMINYGEYDVSDIPEHAEGKTLDGIRIAFHKKNLLPALEMCRAIKAKGYKVFVQAMVSKSYSDEEFLELIEKINKLEPFAFYIVDSFGNMRGDELIRFYSLAENNLNQSIRIGFHSHNNMQLAFSNAIALADMPSSHDIIIDSTIYGMGRGAGNLNTEIFAEYLGRRIGKEYELPPLLKAMDLVINKFYLINPWGYSLPNYLSAVNDAHPNYAGFFSDKSSLTVEAMDEIFRMMDPVKKLEFDKRYAEEIYLRYMESGKHSVNSRKELESTVRGHTVLLIGPGRSSATQKDSIIDFAKSDTITVSVNFGYPHLDTDYIFVSNMRRFNRLSAEERKRAIVTSNIISDEVYMRTDYKELLNDEESVSDNAGMMAVKLFSMLGAARIVLAGFDGYSYNQEENYADSRMEIITKKAILESRNEGMAKILGEYSKKVKIEFLTQPLHYKVE
jgi:4-hydroxy 2-oxovalerate aldolase